MNVKSYEDISQRTADIAAQQKIAEGIQNNGIGTGGDILLGMTMANSLGQTIAPARKSLSLEEQIELVKKLKELLQDGILTQDEFEKKKKEIMGL